MHVLIIEDSQQVMETVVDYLELEGVECDCAYDGRQALARVASMHFDVVIADICMPGMDGISAVREMRGCLHLRTPREQGCTISCSRTMRTTISTSTRGDCIWAG